MSDQEEQNRAWMQTVASNVGQVTVLSPPVRTVPGLRKPYQYQRSAADVRNMVQAIKHYLGIVHGKLQCDLVETKATKYGVRFNVFLLAHRPYSPNAGMTSAGCTRPEWDTICAEIRTKIANGLGEDFIFYVEPWQTDSKFQARFETYIKYSEL